MSSDKKLERAMNDFFTRSGLKPQDQSECHEFLAQRYSKSVISTPTSQGYCSMTMFVNDDLVVQFRPLVHRLDERTADAARAVYAEFAPRTRFITTLCSGLLVYEMGRISGISYQDFRRTPQAMISRRELCKDFARFVSKSWYQTSPDFPLERVGVSIIPRLKSLITDLPVRFQPTARHILHNMHLIEALPWGLTHGDIVAGNIMVDPTTGNLTGFVDWAEAERLPFGVCFYGLEEILGEMTPQGFRYCLDSEELRDVFWTELVTQIPELRVSTLLASVELARDLGVLLWHGIAFDNGNIDRVVQEGRDVDEIYRLDAFLALQVPPVEGSKSDIT